MPGDGEKSSTVHLDEPFLVRRSRRHRRAACRYWSLNEEACELLDVEVLLRREKPLDEGQGDIGDFLPAGVDDEGVTAVLDLFDFGDGFVATLTFE